jgi:hypothetical protein
MRFLPSILAALALNLVISHAVLCQQDRPLPRVTVSVTDGSFRISGLVSREATRETILTLLKRELSVDVPREKIVVDDRAVDFGHDWEARFALGLRRVRLWKSGIYNFTLDPLYERTALSARLSAATALDIDGSKPTKLIDDRKAVIAVTLFATWAAPSWRELAMLQDLYLKHGIDGFEVVAIDSDEEPALELQRFKKTHNLTFRLVVGENDLVQHIMSVSRFQGIPQTLLLKDGQIVAIFRGSAPRDQDKFKQLVASSLTSSK